MTTTAHEDQFTADPEHVTHRPYDTAAILRQNVADLEMELQRQKERAEAAEAELAKLREQEPVAWCDPVEFRDDPWSFQGFRRRTSNYPTMPLYAAPIPAPAPDVLYTPGDWYMAKSREEIQAFYLSRLPAIREAAHSLGYAIGLHGSTRRDLDLIAVPWREGFADKDALAQAISIAACGIACDSGRYVWEEKPAGRVATSFAICWTPFPEIAGSGCVDLSVVAPAQPAASASTPAQNAEDSAASVASDAFVCEAGYEVPNAGACPYCGQDEDGKCKGWNYERAPDSVQRTDGARSERITDMEAALDRSHKRSTDLLRQCRDHDARRAAAVAQASGLAEELDRITKEASEMDVLRGQNLAILSAWIIDIADIVYRTRGINSLNDSGRIYDNSSNAQEM